MTVFARILEGLGIYQTPYSEQPNGEWYLGRNRYLGGDGRGGQGWILEMPIPQCAGLPGSGDRLEKVHFVRVTVE